MKLIPQTEESKQHQRDLSMLATAERYKRRLGYDFGLAVKRIEQRVKARESR